MLLDTARASVVGVQQLRKMSTRHLDTLFPAIVRARSCSPRPPSQLALAASPAPSGKEHTSTAALSQKFSSDDTAPDPGGIDEDAGSTNEAVIAPSRAADRVKGEPIQPPPIFRSFQPALPSTAEGWPVPKTRSTLAWKRVNLRAGGELWLPPLPTAPSAASALRSQCSLEAVLADRRRLAAGKPPVSSMPPRLHVVPEPPQEYSAKPHRPFDGSPLSRCAASSRCETPPRRVRCNSKSLDSEPIWCSRSAAAWKRQFFAVADDTLAVSPRRRGLSTLSSDLEARAQLVY